MHVNLEVPSEFVSTTLDNFTEPTGTNFMPTEVLLVDDSEGDVRLPREALREAKLSINLNVAADGVDGPAFLRRGLATVWPQSRPSPCAQNAAIGNLSCPRSLRRH